MKGGMVETKGLPKLHPVALQWASGGNEGTQHRGGLPPIAIEWH